MTVVAEARADVTADGQAVGDAGEVRGKSRPLEVRVPEGTDLVVGTVSGGVELRGELGHVGITTVSGSVTVDRAASLDARTKSGRVTVRASDGVVRVKTGSSPVQVDHAGGEVRVASVSGTVTVADAAGPASIRTVSGKVTLGLSHPSGAMVETVSGTVRITVPPGTRAAAHLASVSGKRQVECDPGDDLDITARSVSGNLLVTAQP